MKTLISTDTSCLVRNDALKNYDISLFPLNVIVDGEEFLDGITINQEQLKLDMRAGKNIKTSTPPLGTIIEYFEGLFEKGYEHIIHFTISSKLSSMYDLFCNVAKQNFEGKITVINSSAVSAVMLSQVFYAYEEVQKGTDIESIKAGCSDIISKSNVCFVPENLTALKNGGRISPAVALIGNTIGIKPVIVLKDGELQKDNMTRRVRRTFTEKIDSLVNNSPITDYDYTLVDFDGKPEEIEYIAQYAQTLFNGETVIKGILPVNVCAHCGPGTIGLVVTPKINGKSLKEFF